MTKFIYGSGVIELDRDSVTFTEFESNEPIPIEYAQVVEFISEVTADVILDMAEVAVKAWRNVPVDFSISTNADYPPYIVMCNSISAKYKQVVIVFKGILSVVLNGNPESTPCIVPGDSRDVHTWMRRLNRHQQFQHSIGGKISSDRLLPSPMVGARTGGIP